MPHNLNKKQSVESLVYYFFVPALFVVVGLIIYSNTFKVPFHFDDLLTIVGNTSIKRLNNIPRIWFYDPSRFLTYLSFAVNYRLGGLDVKGYHVVNMVLHLGVTLAVYVFVNLTLLRDQCKNLVQGQSKLISACAAFIFLAHPLQTQAVTYISQRSTVMAALCYILGLIFYIFYRTRKERRYYFYTLLTFSVGLFTKPIIITFPFACFLYEIFFFDFSWKKGKKILLALLPFLLLALVVPFCLMYWKYKAVEFHRLLQVTQETTQITRMEYLLTQFNVLMTYLRLLVLPINQNLDYGYPIATSLFGFPTWISFCSLGIILVSAVKLFSRNRLVSFCMFWMFLTLSLESSIFPISDVINEHRLYLPMIGFATMVSFYLWKYLTQTRVYLAVMMALVVAFSVLTYKRNYVWRSQLSLLLDMSKKSPRKSRVFNNLGNIYSAQNKLALAEEAYKKSIALRPTYPYPRNNLANVYFKKGQLDLAEKELLVALALNPKYAGAYYNLGNVYWKRGNWEEGEKYFVKALEAKADFVPAIVSLGRALARKKDFKGAKFYLNSAIYYDPGYAPGYFRLGDLYLNQKRYEMAIQAYRKAVELDPGLSSVHNSLANIYDMTGRYDQAVASYWQAIRVDPEYAHPYFNLGKTLQKLGHPEEARRLLNQALELYQKQGNQPMVTSTQNRIRELR